MKNHFSAEDKEAMKQYGFELVSKFDKGCPKFKQKNMINIEKIAKKWGLSPNELREILRPCLKPLEAIKEAIPAIRPVMTPIRYNYYCNECKKPFRSKLKIEDVICVRCGSSNITEQNYGKSYFLNHQLPRKKEKSYFYFFEQ